MKHFLLLGSIFLFSSLSLAYECKVSLPGEITYYGQCYEEGDKVVFRSCVEFNCVVDKKQASKLKKGEGCLKKPLLEKDLKSLVEKEEYPNKVSTCGKGL